VANSDLDTKDRASRQEAAVAMRIAGANYSEIARVLEYASPTLARQAVERSIASTTGTPETREHQRFLESRRLERLLRSLWNKATDEKNEEHLAAIRTAVAIIDRHSRLNGLDQPTEMVVYTPASEEIQKWVAMVSAQMRSDLPDEDDILTLDVIKDTGYGDQ
jgi:hypothetical protein